MYDLCLPVSSLSDAITYIWMKSSYERVLVSYIVVPFVQIFHMKLSTREEQSFEK